MMVYDALILRKCKVSRIRDIRGHRGSVYWLGDHIMGVRDSRAVDAGLRKEYP